MFPKGKLRIIVGSFSFLVVLYGVSAAFYGKVVAKDEAYKELSVFMDVLKKINEDYVEAPNMNSVQDGAMRGLVDALDPYSGFLSKEQYEALEKQRAEAKAGLGMVVSKRSEVIYVVACERDGPADEAGLRPGDYLIAVNDQPVEDKSILEAESQLRGNPGTKVKLTIFRNSKTKNLELTMRDPNSTPVTSRMLSDNVGLLGITSLTDFTAGQALVKLKTLVSAGARKIVLDLRGCAQGTPQSGADLANYFLQSGVIYYSQDRKGEKIQVVEADPGKFVTDLPLAVLIDGSTAGAAEIVAGALKDQRRATVVGEKSFGVGSAQKILPLKSGAVLVLSTAKFCTPSGKVIQDETISKAGIAPDIQSPDEERRQDLAVESYYDDQEDAAKYRQLQEKIEKIQLDKALEVLSQDQAPAKKAA